MTTPASTPRWPVTDFCHFVASLNQNCLACEEFHFMRDCHQDKVINFTREVSRLSTDTKSIDKRFVTLARRLFALINNVGCECLKSSIQKHRRIFFANLDSSRLQILIQIQHQPLPEAIVEAVNQMSGSVDLGNGSCLEYLMRWGEKDFISCACVVGNVPSRGPSCPNAVARLDDLCLRHFLNEDSKTVPAEMLGIYRSPVAKISFRKITSYVSFGYDPWAENYIGVMLLQSSKAWGIVRINLHPGVKPAVFHDFEFDLRAKNPMSPHEVWRLRELLLSEFEQGAIGLKDIHFIFDTLRQEVPKSAYSDVSFLSRSMSLFIESLFPICMQMLLKKSGTTFAKFVATSGKPITIMEFSMLESPIQDP